MIPQTFPSVSALVTGYLDALRDSRIRNSNWSDVKTAGFIQMAPLIEIRSSATAEKQRVSCICLPRLAS